MSKDYQIIGRRFTARDAKTGERVTGILLHIDEAGNLYLDNGMVKGALAVTKCVPEGAAPSRMTPRLLTEQEIAEREREASTRRVTLRLEWKLEDMWLGAYFRRSAEALDVWLCLLPCLPLHLTIRRRHAY